LSDCTEALLRDPKLVKALYRRALALEKLNFYGRAQNDLKNLLKLDPKNSEAVEMLKRLEGKVSYLIKFSIFV
jgi:tetratricopeptide (TPR) repeat protein